MPFDRSKYPADWETFSKRIRFGRGKGRCECTGECGRDHNAGDILDPRCKAEHGTIPAGRLRPVCLTVAHLNAEGDVCRCDPRCADETHVKSMCEGCHLLYDRDRHARHRRKTIRARTNQGDLFERGLPRP